MTDLAVARNIITGLWPINVWGRAAVINKAFDGVRSVERRLSPDVWRERSRQWTQRRVRSIVDGEARRIDGYELVDLEKMAIQEARHEFKTSILRAQRMAAFLQATDADFHEPEIDRLREFFGGMDHA